MNKPHKQQAIGVAVLGICVGILGVIAIVWTVIPYARMHRLFSRAAPALRGETALLSNPNDPIYKTDNLQIFSRQSLLDLILYEYDKGELTAYTPLLRFSIENLERELAHRPTCISCYLLIGKAYDRLAYFEPEHTESHHAQAENAYRAGLSYVPGNQSFIEAYAANLSNQGRGGEALAMIDQSLAVADAVPGLRYYRALLMYKQDVSSDAPLDDFEYALSRGYNMVPESTKTVYERMLGRYYRTRDIDRFLIVARRLSIIDKKQSATYVDIVNYVEKTGSLPAISFGG